MSAEQTWDAVVVGAGVAGMALATQLARRRYRVALVEPRFPPTFRVGESLDWEAPRLLRRLGLSTAKLVAQGKATWKPGAIATNAAQPGVEVRAGLSPLFRLLMALVGRGKPTIHADRALLDADLMRVAQAEGAELVIDRARTVGVEGDRVSGVRMGGGGVLRGRFYADATGNAALFRKAFGIGQRTFGARKVVVRARFPHVYDGLGTRVRTDDSLTEPAWIWDISISPTVTDIGIVVTEADFLRLRRRFRTLRELFLNQVRKHADLAWLPPLVAEDTKFWTCSFQNAVAERSHGSNWIAVGEAAFVVDPILSSGFTASLRTGLLAADLIRDALARRGNVLCPNKRRIYHAKTAAQVETVNRLIEVLWYRGRLRDHYPLALNVLSILAVNFNLNHLHTRWVPRTCVELRLLTGLHKVIDALVPRYNDLLIQWALRRGASSTVPTFTGRSPRGLHPAQGAASVGVWTPPASCGTSCWSAVTAMSSPTGCTPVPNSD
jgi:flavin-dependent dehydrogenase